MGSDGPARTNYDLHQVGVFLASIMPEPPVVFMG